MSNLLRCNPNFEEAAAIEKTQRDTSRLEDKLAPGDPGTYNQAWTDPAFKLLPDRHSRGALATWYLGNKYRQLWAGLAPVAGGFLDTDYPFEHLRGIPVIVSQGSADTLALPERARKQVAAMEKIGLHPRYFEVAGATHGSIVDAALPGIFDFFDESPGK